ncbi:hypothetical protein QTQ65_004392 [Salmonella enterica]|nr:hypothetical protein [Salmonella enterica]EDT2126490.1 hypothetical protein [Salmonella enterica]EIF0351070.1 hypothetical protein [Salmonella enterica]EIF7519362.1 hypothetical protein [Salmonella enterica]ELF3980905.1 hypothetical protein [Salmonella enterica]
MLGEVATSGTGKQRKELLRQLALLFNFTVTVQRMTPVSKMPYYIHMTLAVNKKTTSGYELFRYKNIIIYISKQYYMYHILTASIDQANFQNLRSFSC